MDSVADVGFVNFPRDDDLGIRRTYPFVFLAEDKLEYSLALKTFSNITGIDLEKSTYDEQLKALKLVSPEQKNILIPIDPKTYTTKINYFAKTDDFNIMPFWQALVSLEPAETFKDKIVLVGANMEITHDIHSSPIGLMPGICINANFLMSVLLNRFLSEVPTKINFLILFITALLVSFVVSRFGSLKGFILSLIILTGGFFITAKYISQDIILDFFGLALITILSFLIISAVKYASILIENASLRKLAITDGLTELYVFRYFEVRLNKELRTALDKRKELSLVIFDIDKFKNLNDTYGHDAGNEVLKNISSILKDRSRHDDVVSRFGGEEFAVILPHTDIDGAYKYAETIREAIEDFESKWRDKTLKATISAGVTSLLKIEKTTVPDLIRSADQALYKAKSSGRNKVICSNKKN